MRTFLTLLKREIIDHIAYFAGALVLSGLLIAMLVSITLGLDKTKTDREMAIIAGLIPATIVVVAGLCALGVAQMYGDRTRNISAFLTALPATRGQIFAARIAAGVLAILILLIPVTVAASVVLGVSADEVPLYRGIVPDVVRSIFLTCLACYSVGIYAGWNRRSLAPTLGVLPIVMLVPLLLVIKGFGLDVAALLMIFVLACLAGTWCRFSSSSF
jgi:ABC-type transport system involved in multi-copper enzyme maturation permease subunit